ncbi:benzoate 4-monooxygenase cytochrome P450 [Apiospora arundinis]|uniref:Benzoate 4-monooxygenase cytochrome P450 n=1 Tax=Apiospora arundinis TaxID=335852 RepID=A0ABR2IAD8_9PEZI
MPRVAHAQDLMDQFHQFASSSYLFFLITVSASFYLVCRAAYLLLFHPLAKFPGPKLAALTSWYEAYYDVTGGRFPDALTELHLIYGPIIRVRADQLHIKDAEFYGELYVSGAKRRTSTLAIDHTGLGVADSIPNMANHELHHMRRKPVESFFSRQSVTRMETRVHAEARRMDEKLQRHNTLRGLMSMIPYLRNMTWIIKLLKMVPASILKTFNPNAADLQIFHSISEGRIEKIRSQLAKGNVTSDDEEYSAFHHVLCSDLPETEKTTDRLNREAFALLSAGTTTTAGNCTFVTYFVLKQPQVETRHREELRGATQGFPDRVPRWAELEKLPYLTACIKEGLCLTRFFHRNIRLSPDQELQYKQWTIPKNTPVGMSVGHMHLDPDVYPEPYEYIPERWLGRYDSRMNRNYVPFLRGSRSCLGSNLAYAQLYIYLAVLFRPGAHKMSIECDDSDIVLVRDGELGMPKHDSKGLRVRFH